MKLRGGGSRGYPILSDLSQSTQYPVVLNGFNIVTEHSDVIKILFKFATEQFMPCSIESTKTRFGSRVIGRPTFWETCSSVVIHENMDS